MRLLRLAVETQRWDLAAHAIVLAAARMLGKGVRNDAKSRQKKRGKDRGQET